MNNIDDFIALSYQKLESTISKKNSRKKQKIHVLGQALGKTNGKSTAEKKVPRTPIHILIKISYLKLFFYQNYVVFIHFN